jgi:hypothetical protein
MQRKFCSSISRLSAALSVMSLAIIALSANHVTGAETDVITALAKDAPNAASEAPAKPASAKAENIEIKSPAQEFIRKVPKDFLLNTKAAPRVSAQNPGGGTVVLEEIQVFGKFDPADYIAPKAAPMLVFRASLDGQRPATPKEITNTVLCYIGLCPLLNANGLPIADVSPEIRAEQRLNTPLTPTFGRGTLQ